MSYCKFEKLIEQRYDDATGQWVDTGNYKKGEMLENDSPDCNPDTGDTPIYEVMYSRDRSNGEHFEIMCGESGTTLNETLTKRGLVSSQYDSVTGISIGNCVKEIGYMAFAGFRNVRGELNIPDSVTIIGDMAFYTCYRFTGNLIIPDSVEEIGYSAFGLCTGFTGTLNIPNKVSTIGDMAFQGTKFEGALIIPNSVTSVGYNAFENCKNITSITFSESMKVIEKMTFYECDGITGELIIPDYIECIYDEAFKHCTSITDLVIGKGMEKIHGYAFNQCTGLKSITLLSPTRIILGDHNSPYEVFNDTNNCPIYVPDELVDEYVRASNWSSDFSRFRPLSEK